MSNLACDVAVIGAGTAGLAAERSARRAGAATLLVDDHFAGTTCANVGCMPSKLLIAAAAAAHAVREAGLFGISVSELVVDGPAVMARLHRERDKFVVGVKRGFEDLPDGVLVAGRARFIDATTLQLTDGRLITAKAVVIATGSAPLVPQIFAPLGDRVLTNESIFELNTLPTSLGVVGAGPLGLELAQAMARLGVKVRVFDQGDKLAALKDEAVAAELGMILRQEFPIHLGVNLSVRREPDAVALNWTGREAGEQRFQYLLIAAGRPAQLKPLDLKQTGLRLDEHGVPFFDRATLQCGASSIFIAGDANHDRPVLHEASEQGTIAGANAASFPKISPSERSVPFSIMFTDPSVAVIGAPPSAQSVIGCASYENQGRAKVMARNAGLVRFYAHPEAGRLTGAVMAGPAVEHSAHLVAWAIQQGRTATEVLDLPFYHPTFEEGLKPALRQICAIVHSPVPASRDEGAPPGA